MPTYDYLCDACKHTWEEFQSITAKPTKKCPECKKLKLRRLFGTGAALVFKGTGFYQTDYRSDSYKKAADADKKANVLMVRRNARGQDAHGEAPDDVHRKRAPWKGKPKPARGREADAVARD